jgi:hypothetical protein
MSSLVLLTNAIYPQALARLEEEASVRVATAADKVFARAVGHRSPSVRVSPRQPTRASPTPVIALPIGHRPRRAPRGTQSCRGRRDSIPTPPLGRP